MFDDSCYTHQSRQSLKFSQNISIWCRMNAMELNVLKCIVISFKDGPNTTSCSDCRMVTSTVLHSWEASISPYPKELAQGAFCRRYHTTSYAYNSGISHVIRTGRSTNTNLDLFHATLESFQRSFFRLTFSGYPVVYVPWSVIVVFLSWSFLVCYYLLGLYIIMLQYFLNFHCSNPRVLNIFNALTPFRDWEFWWPLQVEL